MGRIDYLTGYLLLIPVMFKGFGFWFGYGFGFELSFGFWFGPNNHFKGLDCVGGSKSGQQNMGGFLFNRAFLMQN